jgi:phenylalanine-4-hydroxylase
MRDLDLYTTKPLEYSEDLATDHPGFTDPVYKERRRIIVQIAKSYKAGHPIPPVEYSDSEKQTWKTVYLKLRDLYATHACKAVNKYLPLFEANCGYNPSEPAQLQQVSDYLHDLTGWRLRPVMGLLTSREFLNAFAFRVFHATQYIRHPSQPMYTPEPDMCHDLIGHVPLFADPEFAEFSQEIGLASLGVSDKNITRLATLYWFTVEFGICKESNQLRAYGAGLLSSFGELEYCLGGGKEKPEYIPFDPYVASETEYPITKYQPKYFVTESFETAKEQVRAFARSLDRPFTVRYNPLTENIDILDKKESLLVLSHSIQSDLKTLTEAIDKILH